MPRDRERPDGARRHHEPHHDPQALACHGRGRGEPPPGSDPRRVRRGGPAPPGRRLRARRRAVPPPDPALRAGHPDHLPGLRLFDGRGRLSAGDERLHGHGRRPRPRLPGWATVGEDGDRRGRRRRGAWRRARCTRGHRVSATTSPATKRTCCASPAASWRTCTGAASARARAARPTSLSTRPRSCWASPRSTSACRSTSARSSPVSSTAPRFEEFKESYGAQLVCGWASHRWLPHRRGGQQRDPLLPEAQKGAQFIALCNRTDTPILFVQNITGFMVGTRYEQGGIIKDGAKLINAVSNSTVPAPHTDGGSQLRRRQLRHGGSRLRPPLRLHLAQSPHRRHGTQATGGRAVHRAAQRGPGGRASVRRGSRRGTAPATENQIEEESTAQYATGRLWDDGIIDPARHPYRAGHRVDRGALSRRQGTAVFGVVRH